jgi:hypothetical protein
MSIVTIIRTATARDCSCGQDLDDIQREHCPRCGCQLSRAA